MGINRRLNRFFCYYPIEFKEEYAEQLKKAGERFGSKILTNSDAVSFTEYERENGAKCFYLINIRWWNKESASIKLKLSNGEYNLTFNDNDIKLLGVSPDKTVAILVDSTDVDILFIDNNVAVLKGFGNAKITVFNDGIITSKVIIVDGEKIINFN